MTISGSRALVVGEESDATYHFFARLWGADAQGALTNVHMIAEKAPTGWVHHAVHNAREAAARASEISARGRDAYFACAAYSSFNGSSHGNRTKANALGASCFWLDLDCGEDKAYPDKQTALRALRDFCRSTGLPKPSFFVDSGNGLHVYWQFRELVEKDTWRAVAENLKRLTDGEQLKTDPSRTADIASVLRVPGTHNWKDPDTPKPVLIRGIFAEQDLETFTSSLETACRTHAGNRALNVTSPAGDDGLGDKTMRPALPPVERMRAMLEYLAARNYFEGRKPWIGVGMALKVAYGDEVGLDLWSFTHIDDRAREDAAGQWASFAAEPQPGHVTIATFIKAAKDAGFEGFARISQRTDGAEAHDVAAGYVSYSPFTMDPDDGLTKEVIGRSKNAPPVPVWVSSPFEVLGRYRDPRGRGWGKLLQFRDADGCIHMRHVSDAVLQGDPAGLCADLADNGLRINRSHQRELADYLTGVSVSERVTIVSQTGWQEVGGQRVFVLPDEAIAADMSERVVLDAAAHGPYEARGSLEDWKQGVGTLTASHALPVFMVSAALAGPLAHLAGAEGGGVHVYGQSSIGKSAMLAAGASVWGRGGTPGYVRSWRATANGLEGAAASATDTCLVLDELGVGNPREVADSVYALANGSGKQRARRDGSLQDPRAWRVFVLSSGEVPIEGKIAEDFGRKTRAGQTVRLIDIPADCGLAFGAFDHAGECNDAGKLADAIKEAARTDYGVAGPEFVRRLMGVGLDRVAAEARKMVVDFVDKFVPPGAAEQISRVAKKFALIGIAGALATSVGVTPWAEGEAQRAARRMFERWLETRGGANSHEERQAVGQVRRLIVQYGDSRFECIGEPGHFAGGGPIVRDRLGWTKGEGDKREWWVPPETWAAEFCAGMSPPLVAKTLSDHGMLRRQDKKNLMCVVRPQASRTMRCYVLTAAILDDGQGDGGADALRVS
jgi:putative DNA primase/helicase